MLSKNGWITEFIKRCTRCKYRKLKGNIEPCKSCDDELSNFEEKEVEGNGQV